MRATARVLAKTAANGLMRALVKAERGAGLKLVRDAPVPKAGPNDVLVRIRHAAICGTDLHIFKDDEWAAATVPVPMVVGHEYMGEIAELGSEVRASSPLCVGDRVTGEGHITCGYCRNCRAGNQHLCRNTLGVGVNRPGAFADYVSLPARNVVRLSPDIPDVWGAVMDPLGNAVHTALAYPDKIIGEDVLITGAGPIGIMAAGVCRQVGARHVVVTDVREERLELARRCGATLALNVTSPAAPSSPSPPSPLKRAMDELDMTEGFDVGLEMSGVPSAFRGMLAHMNHGGRVAMLGIPSSDFEIDWNEVVFKGLTIRGIYGREMFETWYTMSNMMTAGLIERIAPVITHRFPMEQYEAAFAMARSGKAGKVVMDWLE